MKRSDAVLFLTLCIYENYGGMTNEDYENVMGEKRRPFNELEIHNQDDYRNIAESVLENMEKLGMLVPWEEEDV